MSDRTFGRKKAATSTFSHPSLVSPHTPTLANPVRGFGLPTNNVIQTQTLESTDQQGAQSADEKSLLSEAIQQRSFAHDFSRIAVRRPQAKLTVGEAGDKYEQEADWMANQVMRMVVPDKPNADSVQPVQDSLQRKCTACEQEEDKIQTKPSIQTATDGGLQAGDNIESRLNSSKGGGSALSDEVRSFMEPRFGADFSSVRVHTGSDAVQMNRELGAQAFTHGSDVYFGAGKSAGNNELTAHELTHVVQQTEALRHLQRACLPAANCSTSNTTLENFVKETENKPENISKADKRKKACGKVPPSSLCTSDGHGSAATALMALMNKHYKSRLSYITGIYVDKDIPADYGAVTSDCANFTPPLPGGTCTFVPNVLEAQAKLYQTGNKSIGGKSRKNWLTSTLGTLTHETEHARFDAAAPISEPSATACKFADYESNLSEMAAHFSEMHVYYRAALSRPSKDRFKQFYAMFDYWVKNGSEDINGIVKDLRCKCECKDADYYITKTAESVSSNQKWDTNELSMIHTELQKSKWGLNWPIAPPATINAYDLPTEAAAPFKLE